MKSSELTELLLHPNTPVALVPVVVRARCAVGTAVVGQCHIAAELVALMLARENLTAHVCNCDYDNVDGSVNPGRWGHTIVTHDGWGIDLTRAQFDPGAPIVFRLADEARYSSPSIMIRSLIQRGFTPRDAGATAGEVVTGNEPCLCGSGLKHKRCCGA